MKTILVSGASGVVGYGILRALRQFDSNLRLIGTSIYSDSAANAFSDLFELAPPTIDPAYMSWLVEIISRHAVAMIIPGIEADMYAWNESADQIRQAGAYPLLNQASLIDLCRDKWAFYERLRDARIDCVIDSTLTGDFDVLASRFGLPFLLKPRRGFGSKGIVRVADAAAFERHRDKVGPVLLAQPIVGRDDEEYTVAAFGDGKGGGTAQMAMRRKLAAEGFTEKAEVVSIEPFASTVARLISLFRPLGPTNFQFRKCDDGLKLLEINPRISSSTSIRAAFGYNEAAMAVSCFLDHHPVSQPRIRGGRAVRYTEEIVTYEDGLYF